MHFRLFMACSTVSFWEHHGEADGCFDAKYSSNILPFSKLICLDDFSDDFSHFPLADALLRVCSFVYLWGCFIVWVLLHFLSSLRIQAGLAHCVN